MLFGFQDWLSDQWIWLVLAAMFILGVGVIWPMSDASYRERARPLRPAKLKHWREQEQYTLAQAVFLWFGHEPPRREAEISAWLGRSASLRVMFMQLRDAMKAGDGPEAAGFLVDRLALKTYAAMRFQSRGERIPAFLHDLPAKH